MLNYAQIDRVSVEPLYLQLRNLIAEAIRSGQLQPGQQVPSIATLCAETGISRMTVRKAIDMLIQDQWLQAAPGKGTFVLARPKIVQSMQHLMGWTDEMRSRGFMPSTQLISARTAPVSLAVARHLELSPHERIIEIIRLRGANDLPLVVETSHVSERAFPGLVEAIQQTDSLYQLLRENYGVRLTRAYQSIEASVADAASAQWLKIRVGSPVLATSRIAYDHRGRPVEYVYAQHRADAVRFVGELNSDPCSSQSSMREINAVGLWNDEEGE